MWRCTDCQVLVAGEPEALLHLCGSCTAKREKKEAAKQYGEFSVVVFTKPVGKKGAQNWVRFGTDEWDEAKATQMAALLEECVQPMTQVQIEHRKPGKEWKRW